MRIGSREFYIRKIMETYGYDRENAEKAFEYMKYKRTHYTLGKCSSMRLRPSLIADDFN